MIPIFPKFKKLELSDQQQLQRYSGNFLPYSDFDFLTMWTWDTDASTRVSILNDNLVFLSKDIHTGELICSFLGSSQVNNTIHNLFDFLDSNDLHNPKLSLVPEDSLKGIDFGKYFIEFDLNSCDYVYDLKDLSTYIGNRYMQKRGRTNNFVRNYPDVIIRELDLTDLETQQEILTLNNSWANSKIDALSDNSITKESLAIERFISAKFHDTVSIGIFHDHLIGFAIFSLRKDGYSINHFFKADISFKGVNEFLMRESASRLNAMQYKFLNFQEDMGLPGLRQSKLTYRPVTFLRKYFIHRV